MNVLRLCVVTALVLVTGVACWPLAALSQDSAPTGQNAAVEQPPGGGAPDQSAGQSFVRTEELLQTLALADTIPTELRDPAFDRYVDLALLGTAWADLDAPLMTDVALQFMEGERVLMRPHKAINTDVLMEVAVRMSTVKNDRESLQRLAKASKLRGNNALSAKITAAGEELLQKQPADPAQNIPIESLSAEAFALYKACLLDIDAAVIAEDAHALDVLEEELPQMSNLPEQHRAMLKQKIETARKSVSDKAQQPSAAAGILDKLAATTRSGWQIGPGAATLDQGYGNTPPVDTIEPTPLDVDDGIRQGGPNRPDTPTYPENPPETDRPPWTWRPPETWTPPRVPPNKYRPPYYPPQQQQQWWPPQPPQPPQPPRKPPYTPPRPPWKAGGWQGGGQYGPDEGFSRRYYIME